MLCFTVPPDGDHKTGVYEDFDTVRGTVRVIYFDENISALKRIYYNRRISKLTKEGAVCGETLYKNGRELAAFYIKSICDAVLDGGKDILICSKNIKDCDALREIILSFNVKFLTEKGMVSAFREYLAEEFGIADGASAAAPPGGKCVIVTDGCESFNLKGAREIINISGAPLEFPCISPETLFFKLPAEFSGAPPFLKRCDYLQTALDFFGFSYENTKLLSVKTGI